ncbi:MAG: thiolase family protein [Candidatus Marsarchaeota archaeon]|nr:thiolase family protein [Candidatus Marsarchaeota archaeon]
MELYIVSAARTPLGKFGGVFRSVTPVELGSVAIKGAISRAGIEPGDVDIAVMGNILRAGHGQNVSRQAATAAGIPMDKEAYGIDMVCSSGMMSVANAAQMIKSGDADIVIAGGMESMSQSSIALKGDMRWGVKLLPSGKNNLVDTMQVDGLTDPFNMKPMGEEADALAREYGVMREELDRVSFDSHMRASKALSASFLQKEIEPVNVSGKPVSIDEGIRADTTMEKLSMLKPVFSKDGMHTAGNSSQLSDGAAALVIAGENAVKERGITPIARITGYSWAGVESERFIEAPVAALEKLSKKSGLDIKSFDYYENNEAFALNSVVMNRRLGIDYEKMNAFGGAIALGHPIGASGARIIATLLNVLSSNNANSGVASICHGTGGATALSVEMI